MAQRLFVTGSTGFCGAHILDLLLKEGYYVRGTVRSQKKADFIKNKYPQYKSNLDLVLVEDISAPHAFDNLVKDVDGIIHVASPVAFSVKNIKDDLIDPAVNLTKSILSAAHQSPTVKRVVITSSIVAIYDYSKTSSYVYTEKDWNPFTYENLGDIKGHLGYVASKAISEKAAWEFMEQKKPKFDIVTLCPTWVFGPMEHQMDKLADMNESSRLVYDVMTKGLKDETESHCVDVRDVALAHLLAYKTPQASNQRYIIDGHSFSWQQVLDVTHKYFPDRKNVPVGKPGLVPTPTHRITDSSKAIRELGMTYLPLEQTFKDTIGQFIDMEKQGM